MQEKFNLEGWKRTGIALSILWFTLVAGYLLYEISTSENDFNMGYAGNPPATHHEDEKYFLGFEQYSPFSRAEIEEINTLIDKAKTKEEKESLAKARDLPNWKYSINFTKVLLWLTVPVFLTCAG